MTGQTLLSELRALTKVDCDTLDIEVAKSLGPFIDCTSNQAIAFGEVQKPEHEQLIRDSILLGQKLSREYENVSPVEIAVEVIMAKLSLRMAPYLTGFVHTQTNPHNSYSTSKTVANANRIVDIYRILDPKFDSSRVCIKIPSTWEGLAACRILEKRGVATLATTLFSMEQAALAADSGCTYIAPYVNQLKVHFVPGHIDNDKGFDLCRLAQRYFRGLPNCKTQVLPASLVSIHEVIKLAGVDHITVSPPLLKELVITASGSIPVSDKFINDRESDFEIKDYHTIVKDESAYRLAYTRSKNGADEGKLTQAINIFSDMQDNLETLVKSYI